MSRSVFSINNSDVDVFSFQKSGATASFDPYVAFPGSRRVSWRLDNGSGITQVAGGTLFYTGFTSDSSLRTIEIRVCNFNDITDLAMADDKLFGHIDLSRFDGLWNAGGNISLQLNPGLTAITNPSIGIGPLNLSITNYNAYSCNLTGDLDLTPLSGNITVASVYSNPNLTGITFNTATTISNVFSAYGCDLRNLDINFTGTSFQVQNNTNLSAITHQPSTANITSYQAYNCGLDGTLDLSMINVTNFFRVDTNSNLRQIIHNPAGSNISNYQARSCDLTGHHDMSMISGLSFCWLWSNPNLTGITHGYSNANFSQYWVSGCDLTGNLDLSMFTNLGGYFNVGGNSNLTGITHTASTRPFTNYIANGGLAGTLDLSMLTGLGGRIELNNNANLTGLNLPTSTEALTGFEVKTCDITGTLDLTGFASLGSASSGTTYPFHFYVNPNLTNILFPSGAGYLRNQGNNAPNAVMGCYSCDLGYVDFKPLSGCTLISGSTQGIPRFEFFSNSMTTAEVNHILSDFDLISTLNYSGWTATSGTTGGYIDISLNSAPDGSTGGFDGTGATVNLVAKGWTVITD